MSGMWKRLPGYISYESKRRFFGLKSAKVTSKKERQPDEIHADAREATARQVCKALAKQDCPDLAIAIVLMAIDDWYSKGLKHGAGQIILPPLMSR
jgi:hypothetical protein